ncbi:hypothetical protein V6Z11_A08G154100 [Gossypium hirsutum]
MIVDQSFKFIMKYCLPRRKLHGLMDINRYS